MNHPDIDTYKQDLAVFRIRDLNAPGREILDKGTRKTLPRHHELSNADDNTFFFLDRGTLHLSCIAEDGQERVVMIMWKGAG